MSHVSLFADKERGREGLSESPKVPTARTRRAGCQGLGGTSYSAHFQVSDHHSPETTALLGYPRQTQDREQQDNRPAGPGELGTEGCA